MRFFEEKSNDKLKPGALHGQVTPSGVLAHFPDPRLWIVSVLPTVSQMVFCSGAKKMALLYKENS